MRLIKFSACHLIPLIQCVVYVFDKVFQNNKLPFEYIQPNENCFGIIAGDSHEP